MTQPGYPPGYIAQAPAVGGLIPNGGGAPGYPSQRDMGHVVQNQIVPRGPVPTGPPGPPGMPVPPGYPGGMVNPPAPQGTGATPNTTEQTQWAGRKQLVYFNRPDTINAQPNEQQLVVQGGQTCPPSWWILNVVAREWTHAQVPGAPVSSRSTIVTNGVRISQLQGILEISGGAEFPQQYPIDIGAGFTWSGWGMVPKFDVLFPDDGFIVTSREQTQPDPPFGELLNETLISFSIQKASPGAFARSLYQETFSLFVPADVVGLIPIPYGTQYVEVFQDSFGGGSVSVEFSTAALVEIAQLDFEPGLRRTGCHRVPGNAAFIETSPTLATDRRITAIFEKEL